MIIRTWTTSEGHCSHKRTVMDLLPKCHTEFGSADYWEKFFKKRGGKAFEWYGEYPELCGILHKYIKSADSILMIGCGNSSLSADLYDVGYHSLTNIDISEVVIKQMVAKHREERPHMKWLHMDMLQMEFGDGEFSVVLDKGTLDAVMTGDSAEVEEQVERMFTEIARVLRVGGRYICVSLAQQHILKKVLHYFTDQGWMIRICRVEDEEDGESNKEFHMPVFVYVLTKFKKMPNMKQILEVAQFEEKIDRYDSTEQVINAITEMQQYGVIRQQLNSRSHVGEHISLDLYSAKSNTARYTLHVVDSPKKRAANKFAIFIVPEGRETEFLFCTNEGRTELSGNAGFGRLVVVTLHRDQQYGSLEDVKAELSAKVMELAPPDVHGRQVPFLSVGDDINKRCIKQHGQSEFSGRFVVEDVETDTETLRRLVFMNNKNVVQSEAKLYREVSKKKGGKKKTKMLVDTNHLSVGYYSVMVAGLALLDDFHRTLKGEVSLLLIGLGGGGLPTFIHRNYPKVHQDVVEIDAAVVNVARDWFGFVPDERMQVHVADGIEHVNKLAAEGVKKHIVMLDVDSKDTTVGMSCPPVAFIEVEFLKSIDTILQPNGVFILNLVCRSQSLKDTVISNLKTVFSTIYSKAIRDDVNEIVFAMPSARETVVELPADGKLPRTLTAAMRVLQDAVVVQSAGAAKNSLPRLTDKLEGLHIL